MRGKFLFFYNSRNLLWGDFKFHQDKGRQEMLQRTEGSSTAVNASVSVYEMKPAVSGKNRQVNKAEDRQQETQVPGRTKDQALDLDNGMDDSTNRAGKLDPVEDSSHSLAANIKTGTHHFIFVCVLSKLEWRNIQHKKTGSNYVPI